MRQSTLVRLLVVCCLGLVSLGFAQAATTPEDKAFKSAEQLFNLRMDTQAIDELQKFVATYPNDPRIYAATYMVGRAHQRQQRYDKALEAYTVVVTKAVGDDAERKKLRAETHYQMAECYLAGRDYDRAARSYSFCLQLAVDPDMKVRAQYWLAECYFQVNKLPEALAEYRRVPEMARDHVLAPWALYSMGDIALRQQNYAQAITDLERVTRDYDKSEVAGEAMLTLAFAYRGRATKDAGGATKDADNKRATELFSAVLQSEKATATARQKAAVGLGHTYFDQKDFGMAADAYAKAVKTMDGESQTAMETRLWRGHALFNNLQYSEAIGEYARVAGSKYADLAAQANYWAGHSWYQLAAKQQDAKAYAEAVNALKRFLATAGSAPAQSPARATLYVAFSFEDLAKLGQATAANEAIKAYTEIITRWPGSREAIEAQAGITRMTSTMDPASLRDITAKLPDGALSSVALRLAREEFLAKRYDAAITEAKKVVDSKLAADLLAQAHYLIGASQHKLGRLPEAVAAYTQALAQAGDGDLTPLALRGLTQAYLDQKNFPDAIKTGLTLVNNNKVQGREKAEARMFLAEAYLNANRLQEATDAYTAVIKEHATLKELQPNALLGLAWTAEKRGDRKLAIDTYRQLIAAYPDHEVVPEAFFHLGINLAEQKEYAAAIEAYKNVPASHPMADQVAYAIAWAYYDQGKHDEANAQFAKVAEAFPKSALASDSLYRIGEYHLERKSYTDAMLYFGRALDLGTADKLTSLIAYKLGVSAFYAEQYAVSDNAFGKVAANPLSEYAAPSLFWRGQALEKLGKQMPARDAYQSYVTKYPKGELVLDAALGAGRAALLAKQPTVARGDLQKALQLCEKEGKGTNATLNERAKNVEPEAQFYLSQTYFEEKNYSEALKQYALVHVYGLEPWYSRSLLQMAECSALLGDTEAAQRTLELLIRNFAASDAAKQAPALAKKYNLTITMGN